MLKTCIFKNCFSAIIKVDYDIKFSMLARNICDKATQSYLKKLSTDALNVANLPRISKRNKTNYNNYEFDEYSEDFSNHENLTKVRLKL